MIDKMTTNEKNLIVGHHDLNTMKSCAYFDVAREHCDLQTEK